MNSLTIAMMISVLGLSACNNEATSNRSGDRARAGTDTQPVGTLPATQAPITAAPSNCGFSSSLASNVNIAVSIVTVRGTGQLNLQKNDSVANLNLGINITQVVPALLQSMIKTKINNYTQPYTLTLADTDPNFYTANPGWQGLKCVVLPVKRLENASIAIEYEPALPMMVIPNADASVYAQLASPRVISGIKATVIRSSISEIRTGTVSNGSTTISNMGAGKYVADNNFGDLIATSSATPFKKVDVVVAGQSYSRLAVDIVIDKSTTAPIVFGQ